MIHDDTHSAQIPQEQDGRNMHELPLWFNRETRCLHDHMYMYIHILHQYARMFLRRKVS